MLPIPCLNAVKVGSESLSATTKALSEYLVETISGCVEALGHNVVMLHSNQEPVLVQLLKAVHSRRVKRTLVRHGPRASHQSQSKIENANGVVNSVCRAMWLSLENLLHSTADSSRSVEPDEVSIKKRRENCVCACFWESVHEPSVAIGRKTDVQVHIRANKQSGSKMVLWYLGWQGANDRRTHQSHGKWGPESKMARVLVFQCLIVTCVNHSFPKVTWSAVIYSEIDKK